MGTFLSIVNLAQNLSKSIVVAAYLRSLRASAAKRKEHPRIVKGQAETE